MRTDSMIKCRNRRPLVHCITNYVTANDCANLLLACGASPIMADDPLEVQEITAMCNGLVLNMGTPSERKAEAMLIAGREANRLSHPVILDPVGVGSSAFRRKLSKQLLENVRFSVIRGNVSEIAALACNEEGHRGVDADEGKTLEYAAFLGKALSQKTGAVVVVTGEEDVVADGERTFFVKNGCAMMKDVTGTGCQLSALLGAYAAADPQHLLEAALEAVCVMGICGEHAQSQLSESEGNMAYRGKVIDALYHLKPEDLEREARYE